MKHLFMVLLLAMVAVFASSRSHAPPLIEQPTLAIPAIASPSYCEYFDGNTHAVQYATMQSGDDGVMPAMARLEDGDQAAQPSTRIHDDSYTVRREYSNELAMMAQRGQYPLRL